ncbi:thioredoxin, mitochondrial-like isoform X2 [Ctenocephalides felis]|uniref:thioredoxin, mitochondrial-like isoform X2 n=1 Tax=Ctenocephalides felis TaxID=7515 RepID=UPI000E6E5784|nr:thioredoxin, mitochondrial-like isoform X2 [Ctenocephalides felis]
MNKMYSSVKKSISFNGFSLFFRQLTTSSKTYGKFRIQSLQDFDAHVRNSKVPVIVDFFATWCNPCKAMTPRLESIIAENEGKVGTVPVLLAIKNGKVEHRLVGLQDTESIRKFVGNILHEPSDESKEIILEEESKPLSNAT